MLDLILTVLGYVVTFVVIAIFGIVNIVLVTKDNKKVRSFQPSMYRPVPVNPVKKERKEVAVAKPKKPEKQPEFLTVEGFVKKYINLIDSNLQKKKTFSLSKEIMKDLNEDGRQKLAAFFLDETDVVNVKLEPEFTVYMEAR